MTLYSVPHLRTGKYDQNLSAGRANPWANEQSHILHVRDEIAFLESWENLGTASGVLEANLVVGQRHRLERLEEGLGHSLAS